MLQQIKDDISKAVSTMEWRKKPQQQQQQKKSTEPDTAIKKFLPAKMAYSSNPVDIPATFLTTDPEDGQAVTMEPVDFKTTAVPEYDGCYAVVLDNVLSPSECRTLLALAEASVADASRDAGGEPWQPALINVGAGFEVLTPHYRNSDRIIWDNQDIVDRIWQRCLRAPGLGERLIEIRDQDRITLARPNGPDDKGPAYRFVRVNDRMRFLKYTEGQFFKRASASLSLSL